MKILKIRRGFTTNSSASSEWIPPEDLAPEQVATGNGNGNVNNGNVNNGQGPSASFTPYSKVWLPMQSQSSSDWSNVAKGGGLVAVVACAFIADRIWRALKRRKNVRGEVKEQDELE